MPIRTATVASASGLHARPAKLFAQAAKDAGVPIKVSRSDKTVNAASILAVMSLGARQGDEVTIMVEGDDAEVILDRLVDVVETNHDAE